MALPKHYRLRKRQDFSAIYRSGLRQSTVHLTLRALRQISPQSLAPLSRSSTSHQSAERFTEESSLRPTQLGISISQKVSKRAVVRNRIKRRLRAAFRALLPQILSGWQIVIVVKPGATQCDYEQFLQELKQLLIKAEVMHGG
ncbi:MAG: ribonuclease P protein component [Oscillatoriophycideae cyanobacterium NC_groundwater_1537_Pr4_S-0.65um_50_18]|nr:ribonuclease P protein component [Oscillatoriophycideae cyanobacterium NC_groundwater_1537_Pr4_S-0.65um_50_18]